MVNIGLVVSEFNRGLTEEMEDVAEKRAEEQDAEVVEKLHVPGAYDSPLAAQKLCRKDEVDAVVVLGVVIEGDTEHDRVVVDTAASKLTDVSLKHGVPVALGITGPGMSRDEAEARVVYAERAIDSAIDLVDEL
ncbi:MAG: 6,7-dimethyl-8-ribityllumazine synthase [Halobacteria archaeon]